MNIQDNNFTELCAGHVLNALSAEEEQEFQQLLASAGDEQLQMLEEMEMVAAEMATLSPAGEPSPAVKKRIMEIAKASSGSGGHAPIRQMKWYKLAVAAAFVFVVSTLALFFYTQSLEREITQQQATIERLESEVERKEELLTILEARDVDLVVMNGMEDMSPNGYGKVVWDKKGGRALLQVANIPSVPSDKDYQLWFIVNGQPISAGVFAVDDPGRDNFFKIERLQSSADASAFAITMEPKGGMPQPTGDMYLMGNM